MVCADNQKNEVTTVLISTYLYGLHDIQLIFMQRKSFLWNEQNALDFSFG